MDQTMKPLNTRVATIGGDVFHPERDDIRPREVNRLVRLGVFLLAAAFISGQSYGQQPSKPTDASSTEASKAPRMLGAVRLLGNSGPPCEEKDYQDVDAHNDNKISITVDLTKEPPIQVSPKCAKESGKGKLTFAVPAVPAGYTVEIDFASTSDSNGKRHKGPFKVDNDRAGHNPRTGRFVTTTAYDFVLKTHDPLPTKKMEFVYTVYLWDTNGNMVHEVDPGVMVIDNP